MNAGMLTEGHEDSSVFDKVKGIVPVNDSVCHF